METTPVTDAFLAGANLDTIAALMSCDIRQAQTVLRSELHRLAAVSVEPVVVTLPVANELALNEQIRRNAMPMRQKMADECAVKRSTKSAIKAKLDTPREPKKVYTPREKAAEPRVCAASPEMAMYPPAIRESRSKLRRAIWDALRTGPLSLAALAEAVRVSEDAAHITCKVMLTLGLTERVGDRPFRWGRKVQVAEPVE